MNAKGLVSCGICANIREAFPNRKLEFLASLLENGRLTVNIIQSY